MSEWHDITSAAKDGTWYRLFIPALVDGDKLLGHYAPGQREGYWVGSVEHGEWITPGTMASGGVHPTYFMPLPEPPKEPTTNG